MAWPQFMREALRAGIPVLQFWDLTPRETFAAIEAAGWRAEEQTQRDISLAWHTAALQRARRFPALKSLLKRSQPSDASKQPLSTRRQEFEEMKRAWARDTARKEHDGR